MKRSRLIEIADELALDNEFSLCDEGVWLVVSDDTLPSFCLDNDEERVFGNVAISLSTNDNSFLEADELDDTVLAESHFVSHYTDKESDGIALEKAGYSDYVTERILTSVTIRGEYFAEQLTERVHSEISKN